MMKVDAARRRRGRCQNKNERCQISPASLEFELFSHCLLVGESGRSCVGVTFAGGNVDLIAYSSTA